ncbi:MULTISPECIES: hypothetical protein [Bacillus cereus group]|uniref:hypothetical protein n=1 Tax=Bacillus cereus group TaxID=86661 RepID=UPI0018CD1B44|nr:MULTISPECIES: hypothetical protein [Bacillus cereus group]MBG9841057.1 hypothetical protein [Bacillus tropicus]MBG9879798.1 hypothetical protein [Bacillus tropicus]MBG9919104.1 hypothetical protein [Bacillus tropicus]MBJ8355275.1 hypothetical protein [Bacillus mycoides]MED2901875.1 hypothetical protein [Bacillus tropicus]
MILNKKQNIFILLSVIIMILIIGYVAKFIHDQNAAKEKAAEVAIETMKKEKNVDFAVTDVKIEHLARAGFITVLGFDKNNNQNKYYVVINKSQNYKVEYWGDE